jgi:oxygen-dependent protoporphyrinogen oxidase
MQRVVVVGGGIAGLAVARNILDRVPGVELLLCEASSAVGGPIRTHRINGFVAEAGPGGFLNRHPATLRLAARVGLADEVITGCERMRRRFIFSRGRLRRFPDSLATFLQSDLLSLRARVRMLLEPAIPPTPKGRDVTVGEFARRRLGGEAAELLIDPVVSGIYAGDPDRLSLKAALPELALLEARGQSILTALIDSRRGRPGAASPAPPAVGVSRYVSFRRGMAQFVEAIARSLPPGSIQTATPVERVERNGSTWRVHTSRGPVDASIVVSAAPAKDARGYLGGLHSALDRALGGVPHVPVATVSLGFREADVPHPLDGFGHLVPSRERGSVLGVLWASSIFPGAHSPDERALLRVILGGRRDPGVCELDDATLVARARVHLARAIGITSEPVLALCDRHPTGMPQYEVGHAQRLAEADRALLSLPGLFLAGSSFRGLGVNLLTAHAERLADDVQSYLEATVPDRTGSHHALIALG